jgi:hypothetical protein
MRRVAFIDADGYLSLSAKRQKRRSEPETGAEVFRREP